jgi:hypothetical protein
MEIFMDTLELFTGMEVILRDNIRTVRKMDMAKESLLMELFKKECMLMVNSNIECLSFYTY